MKMKTKMCLCTLINTDKRKSNLQAQFFHWFHLFLNFFSIRVNLKWIEHHGSLTSCEKLLVFFFEHFSCRVRNAYYHVILTKCWCYFCIDCKHSKSIIYFIHCQDWKRKMFVGIVYIYKTNLTLKATNEFSILW